MRKYVTPIASAALIAVCTPSMADTPMPAGRWVCEDNACVNPDGIHRAKQTVSAPAIVFDRSANKRGFLVKDCKSGRVTTYGIANLPEDVALDGADFGWMCEGPR